MLVPPTTVISKAERTWASDICETREITSVIALDRKNRTR